MNRDCAPDRHMTKYWFFITLELLQVKMSGTSFKTKASLSCDLSLQKGIKS